MWNRNLQNADADDEETTLVPYNLARASTEVVVPNEHLVTVTLFNRRSSCLSFLGVFDH